MSAYTDDDLHVILQDWNENDPDQAVAINLAREVLRLRAMHEATRNYLGCKSLAYEAICRIAENLAVQAGAEVQP